MPSTARLSSKLIHTLGVMLTFAGMGVVDLGLRTGSLPGGDRARVKSLLSCNGTRTGQNQVSMHNLKTERNPANFKRHLGRISLNWPHCPTTMEDKLVKTLCHLDNTPIPYDQCFIYLFILFFPFYNTPTVFPLQCDTQDNVFNLLFI